MSPADDFLGTSDLSAFNQSVLQSDPYGIAGNSLASWQPNYSTFTPAQSGITAFGKAFLSGLLGNYARRDAADQMNSVIGVLPQLNANPMSVAAPEGVNADAFAPLKATAILKNFQQQGADEDRKKIQMYDLLRTVIGDKYKNGEMVGPDAISALTTDDPAAALSALSSNETGDSHISRLLDSYGITDPTARAGVRTPDEAKNVLLHVEGQADKKAAAQEKANTLLEGKLKASLEKPNTPFRDALALAPLQKIADQFMTAEKPDAQTDMGLFDILNKTYNPGGVLREGLMQMSKDSFSPLNKLQATINNFFSQEGAVLSPNAREQVYNVIKEGIAEKVRNGKDYVDNAMYIAKHGGADTESVISPQYYNQLFGGLTNPAPTPTAALDSNALKQEAVLLKSQGLSNEQVAATLRSKYGGGGG